MLASKSDSHEEQNGTEGMSNRSNPGPIRGTQECPSCWLWQCPKFWCKAWPKWTQHFNKSQISIQYTSVYGINSLLIVSSLLSSFNRHGMSKSQRPQSQWETETPKTVCFLPAWEIVTFRLQAGLNVGLICLIWQIGTFNYIDVHSWNLTDISFHVMFQPFFCDK